MELLLLCSFSDSDFITSNGFQWWNVTKYINLINKYNFEILMFPEYILVLYNIIVTFQNPILYNIYVFDSYIYFADLHRKHMSIQIQSIVIL